MNALATNDPVVATCSDDNDVTALIAVVERRKRFKSIQRLQLPVRLEGRHLCRLDRQLLEQPMRAPVRCSLRGSRWKGRMRRFIRENALSLVLFGLFVASAIGQALSGWHASLEELRQHDGP